MYRTNQLLLLAALLAAAALEAHAAGNVLVLYGHSSVKDTHSQFFDSLRELGYTLDLQSVKSSDLKLKDYDNYLYDHLIIMAPKATRFGGSVTQAQIVEFVDSGRDLVLMAGSDVSDTIRSLAAECGVELDDSGSSVWDHFHYQKAENDHSIVATSVVAKIDPILPKSLPGPVLFKGIAQTVPASNELAAVLLSAEPTAYSHDPKKAMLDPPALPAGSSAALVTALQARNNARILVAGSLDMFSNKYFDAEVLTPASAKAVPSGNKNFCLAAVNWVLKGSGILKMTNVSHRIVDGEQGPHLYRVNDQVLFECEITEEKGGKTKPYKADDVQVSFVMLDPYYRIPMQHDGKGHFSVQFKVPDVYGVFKYVIEYKHKGYSYIDLEMVVPVRPFKHDEYDRFLPAAYPYYASAASTMAAFFVVGLVLLYTK